MAVVEGPRTSNLVTRVQNILLRPSLEWDVIAAEPASVNGLYTGYACILAAIPAVATVIRYLITGHLFLLPAIIAAAVGYVLSLAGLYVIALIVDALAPSFGAERNKIQSMKLVTYASTASWVAGVFDVLPVLGGIMGLLGGIYSLYLIYLGLPKLMKNPADKTAPYLLATVVSAILVYVVIAVIIGTITAMFAVGALATGAALSVH